MTGTRRCPICKKPEAEEYRPFCSRRCSDVDLQRWFSGGYAIAGRETGEDGEEEEGGSGL